MLPSGISVASVFAYSVQMQRVQPIPIPYHKLRDSLRERIPAHLIYLMSGNVVLAWAFDRNAGRILLKLPNGVNALLDRCN